MLTPWPMLAFIDQPMVQSECERTPKLANVLRRLRLAREMFTDP